VLVFNRPGRRPEPGDELRVGDVALTVEQTDGATITRLLVRFPQPAA
jgi:CBS domain containing-hemolysin-like protein